MLSIIKVSNGASEKISEILSKYNLNNMLLEYYFKSDDELDMHYNKHVLSDEDGPRKMKFITKDDYNELAHVLSTSPAGNLNQRKDFPIIGYKTASGRFIKYDQNSGLCVIYADDSRGANIISLYKTNDDKFFNKVNGNNPKYKFGGHLPDDQKKGK